MSLPVSPAPGGPAAKVVAGTSPGVLQHYLTAGIDCQLIISQDVGYEVGQRSRLVSLNTIHLKARLDFDGARPWINTADLLPCLYDFTALPQPLPGTGEVPAVEVAKLAFGKPHFTEYEQPNARFEGESLVVSFGDMATPMLIMGPNYTCCWVNSDGDANPACNQVAIIDQLRAWGFALPVNGRPLLAGVDFIPK